MFCSLRVRETADNIRLAVFKIFTEVSFDILDGRQTHHVYLSGCRSFIGRQFLGSIDQAKCFSLIFDSLISYFLSSMFKKSYDNRNFESVSRILEHPVRFALSDLWSWSQKSTKLTARNPPQFVENEIKFSIRFAYLKFKSFRHVSLARNFIQKEERIRLRIYLSFLKYISSHWKTCSDRAEKHFCYGEVRKDSLIDRNVFILLRLALKYVNMLLFPLWPLAWDLRNSEISNTKNWKPEVRWAISGEGREEH